ncbi:MAG: hypothetical protein DRI01_06655 [Chloroflexi bacterium]|nr:MAG: hypothetical protein DRI01_06655 [Chloroflexota bacterium]
MMDSNARKELRVFVGDEQVSRWIFLQNLGLCFRITANDGGWKDIDYERGVEICRRIVSRAMSSNDIKVSGSMVDELRNETMVSELFSKGRIVI